MVQIRHSTLATGVDSGDGKISKNAWNEDHVLDDLVIADVDGLQAALDAKQAALGYTPYNSTNPSGYISSAGAATLTNKTIALGSNSVSGTLAEFNAALTGADFATGGGTATGTNTGDQSSIVGITGTKAQFSTSVTDGDILYVGDVTQYTDELAQDAVGAMVDSSLVYVDTTPLLTRAALTGDATAAQGSNALTVVKINGVALSGLATGILKNTTGTGAPSIAVAADFPTLNQNTTGSAATLTTPRNIDGQAFNGSANITVIAPGTNAAASKATPIDADELPLVDSAASNVLKKLTWANLKATLKTYFDTLYQALNSNLTTIAGLTATTNNFIVSVSSAWASRTPTQVTALLDTFTTALKGLVPSGGATTTLLRGDATWVAPASFAREVGARIYHNANQSINDSTSTILSFNTTRRANNVTVGADKLTAVEAGWYLINANVDFAANATGFRIINLKLNGTTYLGGSAANPPGANTARLSVSTVLYMSATDYVQVEVYQTSGGALNVASAAQYTPEFQMVKLGSVL